MPQKPHRPLPINEAQVELEKLSDDIEVQANTDTGWVHISYNGHEIARYRPLQNFAKVHLYILSAGTGDVLVLPDNAYLVGALEILRDTGFCLVGYQKTIGPDRRRVDLCTFDGETPDLPLLHKILLRVLAGNREAIDAQS